MDQSHAVRFGNAGAKPKLQDEGVVVVEEAESGASEVRLALAG